MAVIRTFNCVRPEVQEASKVAALPYDVYSRSEAKVEAGKNPHSFLNIDRPETQFPDDYDMYADEVYEKAGEMLNDWIDEGIFIEDKDKAYYIYELTFRGRTQTGLVACASIDDYLNNVIKKHENTREEKELDRIRHVDTLSAQTGPIFLAYRKSDVINHITSDVKEEQPLCDFVSEDGIRHRVFKITDSKKLADIESEFAGISDIYIADGHHRAASAVKVGLKRREKAGNYSGDEEFNYFLSVLFPDDELMIMPYNRVVADLNGLEVKDFQTKVCEKFDISVSDTCVNPEKRHTFGMYLKGQWYNLTLKSDVDENDPVESLDVSVLQKLLLEPVLGIKDPRTDKRIDFVGGIRGTDELEKLVDSGKMAVAFSMYPTSISELFSVADAKMLMPPKSTWFEPKLRSGLFIHKI